MEAVFFSLLKVAGAQGGPARGDASVREAVAFLSDFAPASSDGSAPNQISFDPVTDVAGGLSAATSAVQVPYPESVVAIEPGNDDPPHDAITLSFKPAAQNMAPSLFAIDPGSDPAGGDPTLHPDDTVMAAAGLAPGPTGSTAPQGRYARHAPQDMGPGARIGLPSPLVQTDVLPAAIRPLPWVAPDLAQIHHMSRAMSPSHNLSGGDPPYLTPPAQPPVGPSPGGADSTAQAKTVHPMRVVGHAPAPASMAAHGMTPVSVGQIAAAPRDVSDPAVIPAHRDPTGRWAAQASKWPRLALAPAIPPPPGRPPAPTGLSAAPQMRPVAPGNGSVPLAIAVSSPPTALAVSPRANPHRPDDHAAVPVLVAVSPALSAAPRQGDPPSARITDAPVLPPPPQPALVTPVASPGQTAHVAAFTITVPVPTVTMPGIAPALMPEHDPAPLPDAMGAIPPLPGSAPAPDRSSPLPSEVAIARHVVQALTAPGRDPAAPLELALDPPELGRLRLSFTDTNGMLTLTITAERPETADLMRRHIALLSDEFARAGVDAPMVQISNGGADGRHDPRPAPPLAPALPGPLAPDHTGPEYPTAVQALPQGGLDLRV